MKCPKCFQEKELFSDKCPNCTHSVGVGEELLVNIGGLIVSAVVIVFAIGWIFS